MASGDSTDGHTRRFVALVVRRRFWVLAVIALITALALVSVSTMVVATSFGRMFLGENPEYADYLELSARFGSDQILVIGIDDPDFLTPAGQERLRRVIAELKELDRAMVVRSVLDAFHLEQGPFGPVPVRYADEAAANPDRIPEIIKAIRKDPLSGGFLVSADGRSTAIVIEITPDQDSKAEDAHLLVEDTEAVCEEVYDPEAVHLAGLPAVFAEVLQQTNNAVVLTTPVVAVVLLFTVWLLFGRLWPALISLTVAGVAVVWTLGVAALIDREFNIMMAAVPGVILIIAFSDIVHLCSAYLLELGAGRSKAEAILESGGDVGRACLFTSLTTFVGFVSLSFVPVPVFRSLGIVLGLGVGVALLLAVTMVPILFSLLPAPKPLREGRGNRLSQLVIDRGLAMAEGLATRRPWWVIGGFTVLLALSLAGAAQLDIETNFQERLAEDNPVRVDSEWFSERYHGTNVVQVYVQAPEPGDLEDPVWLRRVATYQAKLRDLPEVVASTSLLNVISMVYRALPMGAGETSPLALPDRREDLKFILDELHRSAPQEMSRMVDREEGRLLLLVTIEPEGMRDTAAAANSINELAGQELGEDTDAEATGLFTLLGDFLDDIVTAQRDGLIISIVAIAVLMVLGLRSLRVGLASMVPNLLPLVVLAACLGVFWDRVDSDSITLTYVALGIGVDDTIHFLSRFRLEASRGGEPGEIIRRTFGFAGRGIVMTTVILSFGFMPFLLSDYFLMRMFGSLLPICFCVALAADLLLIPAMAQVGWLPLRAGVNPAPTEEM